MTGPRLSALVSALSLVSTLCLFGSPFAASPVAGQAKALEIEWFDADIMSCPAAGFTSVRLTGSRGSTSATANATANATEIEYIFYL